MTTVQPDQTTDRVAELAAALAGGGFPWASKDAMLDASQTYWNPGKTRFWIDEGVPLVIDRREGYHLYDVTGSLCENNDKFAVNRLLPKAEIGDVLVIHDTGAHGFCMGYQYNGRLRSAEILYRADGSFQLIRRAETPEDYFATLV